MAVDVVGVVKMKFVHVYPLKKSSYIEFNTCSNSLILNAYNFITATLQ